MRGRGEWVRGRERYVSVEGQKRMRLGGIEGRREGNREGCPRQDGRVKKGGRKARSKEVKERAGVAEGMKEM